MFAANGFMSEPESILIAKVKDSSDSAALTELVNMHSGIYYTIINKYAHTYPNVINAHDLSDDRMFNIYRFILAYEGDRNMKLSSYIGERTDYLCKTLLRKGEHDPLSYGVMITPTVSSGDINSMNYFSYSPIDQFNIDALTTANGNSVSIINQIDNNQPNEIANNEIAMEDILNLAKSETICPDKRFVTILNLRKSEQTWRQIGHEIGLSYEGARKIYIKNIDIIKRSLNEERKAIT